MPGSSAFSTPSTRRADAPASASRVAQRATSCVRAASGREAADATRTATISGSSSTKISVTPSRSASTAPEPSLSPPAGAMTHAAACSQARRMAISTAQPPLAAVPISTTAVCGATVANTDGSSTIRTPRTAFSPAPYIRAPASGPALTSSATVTGASHPGARTPLIPNLP
ncbi:hypothetical protein ACFQ0B_39610 [Nonomuraea thailandensis]